MNSVQAMLAVRNRLGSVFRVDREHLRLLRRCAWPALLDLDHFLALPARDPQGAALNTQLFVVAISNFWISITQLK